MKRKFIIQIKRHCLWEDLVTYTDKNTALLNLFNFRKHNDNWQFRLLEVVCLL